MNAADLLNHLNSRGVELFHVVGQLRYRSSPGAYTPELRAAVAAHRDEIIQLITAEQHADRSAGSRQTSPWPTDLAEWVQQLTAVSLPRAPFLLNRWTTVRNAAKFVTWLQLAAGRRYAPRLGDRRAVADALRLRELAETRSSRHSPHAQSVTPCDPVAALFD